jgi:predicted Fe-S protein YdhL (DUF1289 family)
MAAAPELARLARLITASRAGEVPSPCVSICRMDAVSGLCEGCCRTIDEIAAWSQLDADARREVWRRIGERALDQDRGAARAPSASGLE